jgi:hypothetical protein
MNDETRRSLNAHVPAVFSVTFFSLVLCVCVCVCVCLCVCAEEEHIYTIHGPPRVSNGKEDRERERDRRFFPILFFLFFVFLLCLFFFSLVIMIASISVVVLNDSQMVFASCVFAPYFPSYCKRFFCCFLFFCFFLFFL